MKELEKAVVSKLQDMEKSGRIEEIISEKMEETVSSVLGNILRSWSDFGKGLEESLKKNIQVNFDNLGLAGYNQMVTNVLKKKIQTIMDEKGRQHLEEMIDEMFGGTVPAEISLEDLIEKFKEHVKGDDHEEGQIYLDVEKTEYGYVHIYFSPSEDDVESGGFRSGKVNKYQAKYQLNANKEGEIYSAKIDGYDPTKTFMAGPHYGFETMVFHLYANKAKITGIEEWQNIDTYYGGAYD